MKMNNKKVKLILRYNCEVIYLPRYKVSIRSFFRLWYLEPRVDAKNQFFCLIVCSLDTFYSIIECRFYTKTIHFSVQTAA